MDTVTHALVGLALAACHPASASAAASTSPGPGAGAGGVAGPADRTGRAVLLAGVLGATLPDLDYLWPFGEPALRALQVHRGPTHALLMAPLVAGVAALLARGLIRPARPVPVLLVALAGVLLGHLGVDLWTGWGTRLLWPFSSQRLALDWTLVVDPLVTLPLLVGTVRAVRLARRGGRWRPWLIGGLLVALAYVGLRIGVREVLAGQLRQAFAGAAQIQVFPRLLGIASMRFVVVRAGAGPRYVAGTAALGRPVVVEAELEAEPDGPLDPATAQRSEVALALAWARFPVLRQRRIADGAQRIEVADLRYHLRGQTTLSVVVELDGAGRLTAFRLDRGGSAGDLWRRLRRTSRVGSGP